MISTEMFLRLSGRDFQDVGPANVRPSCVVRLTRGKSSSPRPAERGWQRPGTLERVDRVSTDIWVPCCVDTCTPGHTLNQTLSSTSSQWSHESPELTQHLIILANVRDDSDHSVDNTLQPVGGLLRRTDQETVTVVDPAGDERVDESSRRVVVERTSDSEAQLSKLKEAVGTAFGDVVFVDVKMTPRIRTASVPTTLAPPSFREWQQTGILDTLYLVLVHSTCFS